MSVNKKILKFSSFTFLMVTMMFLNISFVTSSEDISTVDFSTPTAIANDQIGEAGGAWESVSCGHPTEPDYCVGDGSYVCCK